MCMENVLDLDDTAEHQYHNNSPEGTVPEKILIVIAHWIAKARRCTAYETAQTRHLLEGLLD